MSGTEHTLRLDKAAETIRPETGRDDMLFRAVADKIASIWLNGADTPDRFIVQFVARTHLPPVGLLVGLEPAQAGFHAPPTGSG
ncbi:hypothetical protein IU470_15005 [Nocardia abscessus]|uniref:Uncharacterized protein n=1 Tax=Nocardia abscessus TaxID=120957 RepID=A0ABS0CDC6_9NOCA|nr:hypothetical protein [Nocardia abscessus]MBF6226408.1 hypothetical protein [Nocardia abscessus]